MKIEFAVKPSPEQHAVTSSTSFKERGLARRAEGQQYLANDNGESARKRRLKQLARKEERDSRKIVLASCGPAGLLHRPSEAEISGILRMPERPRIGEPRPPVDVTGQRDQQRRYIGEGRPVGVDHVDLGQVSGVRWE